MSEEVIEAESTELARTAVHEQYDLSVEQVVSHVTKIHEVMKRAMKSDHHYGIIPGTPKPTLLKPGAELLCLTFRLDPEYSALSQREGMHLTYVTTCTLHHIPTGRRVGSGMGSCSTRESKYAYRQGKRVCPQCGKDAIIKGKAEYGGGYLCFAKKGGCGAKFSDTDKSIVDQVIGRIPNEDLADMENTVLKMSNKRALVAAVLNCTAASDCFTQDLEDMAHDEAPAPTQAEPEPAPQQQTQPAASGIKRSQKKTESKPQPVSAARETVNEETGEVMEPGAIEPPEEPLDDVLINDIKSTESKGKTYWFLFCSDSRIYSTTDGPTAVKADEAKAAGRGVCITHDKPLTNAKGIEYFPILKLT